MDTDITALIEEATRHRTTGETFALRIGLPASLTKKAAGVPAAQSLMSATRDKVHQIAIKYKTRRSIKAALEAQPSLLYDITDSLLRDHGSDIWNDGAKDGTFVTKTNKPMYPKRLVYKNPRDQLKIRKQLFGWVVQRACRTVGEWGRTGPRKRKQDTPPAQPRVAKAVIIRHSVRHDPRVASFTDIDDESMDELAPEPPKAAKSRRNAPTAHVKLPPSTKKTRMALSNTHNQRSEEEVPERVSSLHSVTGGVVASTVRRCRRPRSTNKVDTGRIATPAVKELGRPRSTNKVGTGGVAASGVKKRGRPRSTNKIHINPQPLQT